MAHKSKTNRIVSPKFELGTLTKYHDAYDRQSRWPPRSKVKVISSYHLYVSSLPLLNLGNCCTCVIRGGRGHTVSAKPSVHTSCLFLQDAINSKLIKNKVKLVWSTIYARFTLSVLFEISSVYHSCYSVNVCGVVRARRHVDVVRDVSSSRFPSVRRWNDKRA